MATRGTEGSWRSTERFSNRAAHYARWRPSYPAEAVAWIRRQAGLAGGATAADVGAGTGLLAARLLDAGLRVVAVEPNEAMRAEAERTLGGRPGFTSVAGSAEATGLADASIDLIAAAQAFHWFRLEEARREFARVLRPGGHVALLWNHRRRENGFHQAYEALLRRHAPEYAAVERLVVDDAMLGAFFAGGHRAAEFPNEQVLSLAGLRGRLLSTSYVPSEDEPAAQPMLAELERVFAAHQEDGAVRFLYRTRVLVGRVAGREAGGR